MENRIVLEAKTNDLIVNTVQNTTKVIEENPNHAVLVEDKNGSIKLKSRKQGTLTIMGSVPDVGDFLEAHNLDNHAHPNLWYIHEQGISSDVWEIKHDLNREPSVTVVDTANNVVMGYVTYIDKNNVRVTFNAAFKGKAYLN